MLNLTNRRLRVRCESQNVVASGALPCFKVDNTRCHDIVLRYTTRCSGAVAYTPIRWGPQRPIDLGPCFGTLNKSDISVTRILAHLCNYSVIVL